MSDEPRLDEEVATGAMASVAGIDPFEQNPTLVHDIIARADSRREPDEADDLEDAKEKEAVRKEETEAKREEVKLRKAKVRFQKEQLVEQVNQKRKAKIDKELLAAHKDVESKRRAGESEDELKEHLRVFRIIQRYRTELGIAGTGRAITINTPLEVKQAELGVIQQQANEKNAEGFADGALSSIIGKIEDISYVTLPHDMVCLKGDVSLREEWDKKVASDDMLQFNIRRIEIEYSSYFAVGPKMSVAVALLSLAENVNKRNIMASHMKRPQPGDLEA